MVEDRQRSLIAQRKFVVSEDDLALDWDAGLELTRSRAGEPVHLIVDPVHPFAGVLRNDSDKIIRPSTSRAESLPIQWVERREGEHWQRVLHSNGNWWGALPPGGVARVEWEAPYAGVTESGTYRLAAAWSLSGDETYTDAGVERIRRIVRSEPFAFNPPDSSPGQALARASGPPTPVTPQGSTLIDADRLVAKAEQMLQVLHRAQRSEVFAMTEILPTSARLADIVLRGAAKPWQDTSFFRVLIGTPQPLHWLPEQESRLRILLADAASAPSRTWQTSGCYLLLQTLHGEEPTDAALLRVVRDCRSIPGIRDLDREFTEADHLPALRASLQARLFTEDLEAARFHAFRFSAYPWVRETIREWFRGLSNADLGDEAIQERFLVLADAVRNSRDVALPNTRRAHRETEPVGCSTGVSPEELDAALRNNVQDIPAAGPISPLAAAARQQSFLLARAALLRREQ